MAKIIRCDGCAKEFADPWRLTDDERESALAAQEDLISISVEHNEDSKHFDACSWACCAQLALQRASEEVADG